MEEYYWIILGAAISCMVDVKLFISFLKHNYMKKYQKKNIYTFMWIAMLVIITAVNCFNISLLNFISWILAIFIISFCYEDEKEGHIKIFVRMFILLCLLSLCESIGVVILSLMLKMTHMLISQQFRAFLNLTITKILEILIYYTVLERILSKKKLEELSLRYYASYFLLVMLSLFDMNVIVLVSHTVTSYVLLINLILLVIVNLYITDLLEYISENNQLKMKLGLFEQQVNLQEKYYNALDERYVTSLKVLHDVDKHIKVIEELYQQDAKMALDYTKDISKMLIPLMPKTLSQNKILNIVLNDKAHVTARNNIQFSCDIDDADLSFIRNTDITTIYANLIDNAIEACQKVEKRKYIDVSTRMFNGMLIIQIKNSMTGEIIWKDGKPASSKGEMHGIGLENVEKIIRNYGGSMELENDAAEFRCNIILNQL